MFLLLLSCTAPEDTADTGPFCTTAITATDPAHGQKDHHYREPVIFWLSEPDPTAVVVADFPGTQTVSDDGLQIVYTLDEPLEPFHSYDASLDYCRGIASIEFLTSPIGSDLLDPDGMVGRGYAVDFSTGRFLEGEGVGELIAAFFGRQLLFEVLAFGDEEMDIRAGISEVGTTRQDECRRTVDREGLDNSPPFFSYAAEQFGFGAYEDELTLRDFAISGTFAPDAGSVRGVAFTVTLQVSELVPILKVGDEDELCGVAEQLGVTCEVCGGHTCVTIAADRISGEVLEDPVLEITEDNKPEDCPP